MNKTPNKITVSTIIDAAPEELWEYLTESQYITQWNHASDDWHTPSAENDFRVGGKFSFRMEAKDGSHGFDFAGEYEEILPFESYSYALGDSRKVNVTLTNYDEKTEVKYVFDAEESFPLEHQKSGWQAILDNFKKFVETKL